MSAAPTLYFEDFEPGQRFDCGERTLTAEEVIAYAAQYDPQPMHLDPAAGAASLLGGHAASGWHVCALIMRLYHDGILHRVAGQGSPGVAETRWRRPALVGRPLALTVSVTDARLSRSRPTVGLVGFATALVDRTDGQIVCAQRYTVLIDRREPGAPAPNPTQTPGGGAPAQPRAPKPAPPTPTRDARAGLGFASAEEIPLGVWVDLGAETVDEASILAFARAFDPQPFHLDKAAAARSLFGALSASGWQTAGLWMRRLVLSRAAAIAALPPEAQARAAAMNGPGLGFTDLQWRRPVLAGDTLRYATCATALDPFAPQPAWRRLRSDNIAVNQHGVLVFRFQGEVLIRA